MGKFKDIKNFFKAIIQFIVKLIKFIPTILGQIVMWIAIIILAIILIYLVAQIISSFIADVLGIADPGLQNTEEYLTLSSLTANGYDGMMSSDELQDYYSYEYAVLMDLARNLEETGTYIPKEDESYKPYDPALITDEEWAQLCADTFVTNYSNSNASRIKGNYATIKSGAAPALTAGITAANVPGATPSSVSTAIQNALPANLGGLGQQQLANLIASLTNQAIAQAENQQASNEMSKEELIYKTAKSDRTGEVSLVPYIVVTRASNIYSYEFEDKSLDITTKANRTKNYKTVLRAGKGAGWTTPNTPIPTAPGSTTTTNGYTWEYIYQYIRPLESNRKLNANNASLFKTDPPGSDVPLDINESYSESVHYAEKDNGTVTYEIPLKTLADRFMPKAVLLSSWYMLKQDEEADGVSRETVDLILAEIKEIYDKACLEKETEPERNFLLVKDVLTTDPQSGNIDKKGLFTRRDLGALNAVDKYASFAKEQGGSQRGTDTHLLYERYDTEFDSRVATETSRETITPPANPVTPGTPVTPTTPQSSLLQATNQDFAKDLKYDLIDDLNLVLTHHNDAKPGFMNEKQYDKALSDLEYLFSRIAPDLKEIGDLSNSTIQEYILYKTDDDGKYVIDCKLLEEEKHHNARNGAGTTHQTKYGHEYGTSECSDYMYTGDRTNHDNPYEDDEECFIPQIKISFARVPINNYSRTRVEGSDKIKETVSVKVTTITIIDGNVNYLYRVEGKEIEDLAGLTNAVSFMKFDRYDASMTNYSDWDEENSAADAEDRTYFIMTDVFEAWPMTNSAPSTTWNNIRTETIPGYKVEYMSNGTKVTLKGREAIRYLKNQLESRFGGQKFANALEKAVDNLNVSAPLYKGGLGILRQGPDWIEQTNNVYEVKEEALIPPTNAAPDANTNANYDTTQIGEAIDITGTFLDVKGLTPAEIQQIENAYNSAIWDAVLECVSDFLIYNDVYYGDVTGLPEGQEPATYNAIYSASTIASRFVERSSGKISFDETNKAVIYPVEMRVTTIKQTVKHKEMPIYLPRYAETWSSIKTMQNTFSTTGRFDPEFSDANGGFMQLVPRAVANQGVRDIEVSVERSWRSAFYAPHFASVRESDVLAMIAEWENAGNKGHFAAYTYIRDIYSLIQKAKEIKVPNAQNDEDTYVHKDSYTYMYIPDEILYFDERVTDKAFWLERILATNGEDSIEKEENLMMRNKRNVKTWQIVDYEKYDECKETYTDPSDGKEKERVNVYGLWPLGGYLGRSLYAFEANSSASGNKKVLSWGAYVGPGVHSGVDLYGRGNALRVYTNAFSNGNAKIKAEYNADGTVTLTDGSNSVKIGRGSANSGTLGEANDEGVNTEGAHNISGNRNVGAYMNTTVPINIDGTIVNFAGSSSAAYGYELYRLTKAYEDGEKAEAKIKEILETEMYNNPVVAIAPGKVVGVKGGARPGFMVSIEHADGVTSNYLHMKRWPEVQVGEYVGAGTILGYEGTTGNSGGYHVHHEIKTGEYGGITVYPIAQLYPFFSPFYYEEKVKDENGNYLVGLESEYQSIVRTVFPVGQIVSYSDEPLHFDKAGQDVTLNQVERDSDGEIVIKNYVPTKKLTTIDLLIKEEDVEDQTEVLNKRIKEEDKSINSEVTYSGDSVVALPQYFDEEFMSAVKNNGGHILTTP